MRRIVSLMVVILAAISLSAASHPKNEAACSKADNIVSKYYINYEGQSSKVRIYRCTNGTYQCQIYWVPETHDKNGNPFLDVHNPDKSKRNTPADRIILIWGLKYDAEDKEWNEGTIYDPRNGMRASCTCTLVDDGNTLRIFGNVLGIGKSVYWTKIKE